MKRILTLIALVVPFMSCGEVVRTGRSPMFLTIDLLQGAKGDQPQQFGNPLLSDVLTIVTSGGLCSQSAPCPVSLNDLGQVTLRTSPKDVTNPIGPTTNNDVTITRYRVVYRRTDGHNVQGLDVPYAFDAGLTGTVPAGETLTLAFEVVRNLAKSETPLVQLRGGRGYIYTIAEITFFGKDRVGNEIQATGLMQVDFSDFADR